LQTASGIPVKFLLTEDWEMQFYGIYKRPIGSFRWAMQKQLKNIYETDSTIKPLNFGIGYGYRYNESHLMLAKRK